MRPYAETSSAWQERGFLNKAVLNLLDASGLLIIALFILLCAVIVAESWPALFGGNLPKMVAGTKWFPSSGLFGSAPILAASLAVALATVLIVAPFSIGLVVFMNYFAFPFAASAMRRLLNVITAVPSVVFGLWGLMTIVPLIASVRPPGVSLLAASLVLAMMVLPTMALLADMALTQIPRQYLLASAALGASRTERILLCLRLAAPGLAAATMFSFCRAIGETMVAMMLAGNIVAWPGELTAQVRTLAANIALEMPYAMGMHRAALFLGTLELIIIVGAATAAGLYFMSRERSGCR